MIPISFWCALSDAGVSLGTIAWHLNIPGNLYCWQSECVLAVNAIFWWELERTFWYWCGSLNTKRLRMDHWPPVICADDAKQKEFFFFVLESRLINTEYGFCGSHLTTFRYQSGDRSHIGVPSQRRGEQGDLTQSPKTPSSCGNFSHPAVLQYFFSFQRNLHLTWFNVL